MSRILILLFFISAQSIYAQSINIDSLDTYIRKSMKDWGTPALSIGIVQDGKIIFEKGYGEASTSTHGTVDEHTLFAIASNSKLFTTTLMGMLVDDQKITWNDKVIDHLPYFSLSDTLITPMVNIRDILSHRVGLGTFQGDILWYNSQRNTEDIVRHIKYLPLDFEFRDGFGYSNLMFITAGDIIHKVTGMTWGQNVQERILNPIGMNRTIYRLQDLETKQNYAQPHYIKDGKNQPFRWANWEEVGATGGIISSAHDMCKWMLFNMDHGIINQDTLLSNHARNMIWKIHNAYMVDHTTKNEEATDFAGYGLGIGLGEYRGHFKVSHTGGYGGMLSSVMMLPDKGLGVVVLTNGMKSPYPAITRYAMDRLLGADTVDWSSKYLKRSNQRTDNDHRIKELRQRIDSLGSKTLKTSTIVGDYHSDYYGRITVSNKHSKLAIDFNNAPDLGASLHYLNGDAYELVWNKPHAWFSFGIVQFTKNKDGSIRLEFDVPNDDFFFEEINSIKHN